MSCDLWSPVAKEWFKGETHGALVCSSLTLRINVCVCGQSVKVCTHAGWKVSVCAHSCSAHIVKGPTQDFLPKVRQAQGWKAVEYED